MAVSMVGSERIVWDKQIVQGMQKMFEGKDRMKIPSAGFITEVKAVTIR